MKRLVPFLLVPLAGLTGCGTSITQFLATEDQQSSIEQLLFEAQYQYDKGNFDDALSAAEKAHKINPYDEETAVIAGYVHLAKAGLEALTLAKKLIEDEEEGAPDTDDTSGLFTTIASVLGVDENEMGYIAEPQVNDQGITLYDPKLTTEAQESGGPSISNLQKAIEYLCPFVDESIKTSANGDIVDSRHSAEACPPSTSARNFSSKAHFAFGLTHLAEAMIFYSVLFYTDPGETLPNIERFASSLGANTSDLSTYATGMVALAGMVNSIFSTEEDSMLNGMFNNLEASNKAFEAMAGLPASFTDGIISATSNARNKANSVQNSGSENPNAEAMRDSLTIGITNDLFRQIEATNFDDSPEQQAQLASICASYRSINDSELEPSKCNGV